MKVAVLYSGGKDSNFATYLASKEHEVKCLINLKPSNNESYMFQSAGNSIIELQSKTMEIPLLTRETSGEKEKELDDLKEAIEEAVNKYKIEGIVTGAIQSAYQSSRIQKICLHLDLWCFNPLWQIDEKEFLRELEEKSFEVILVAVASYPLDESYLGRKLTPTLLEDLNISLIGEGGEFESLVLDSPIYKRKVKIIKSTKKMDSENSGELQILEAKLE